jgi:RimJ/RimL family protein N-acetyltransferase
MAPGYPTIIFTPVTETDLPRLCELVNDPSIGRFLDHVLPVTLERTKAFFAFAQEHGFLLWNIRVAGDGTIGCAGLLPEDRGTKCLRTATFYLYLLPAYWGRGIGTETVEFLIAEARTRRLHRLECIVAAGNDRAIRLYENHGFQREGVKRDAFYDSGQYEDLVVMGKLLD